MQDAVARPGPAMIPFDQVPGLDIVKQKLADLLQPAGPMRAPAAHVGESSGKLLRPVLTLLCASLAGEVTEEVIDTAVAVELIHTASLTHDDVIDESDARRGRPSVRYQFGNKTAVLLGDYLFTTAFELLNRSRKRTVIRSLSSAIRSMSSGELLHLANLRRVDLTEEQYCHYMGLKTASLMSASCEAGALAAGGRVSLARRVGKFGWNLGMAFQIVDDLLDVTGMASTDGKPPGMDLRLGILTLPVIRLVTVEGWGDRISSLWGDRNAGTGGTAGPPAMEEILEGLVRHGCLVHVLTLGKSYSASALEALSAFTGSPEVEILRRIVREVEDRCPRAMLEQSDPPEPPASGVEPGGVRTRPADDFPGNTAQSPPFDLTV